MNEYEVAEELPASRSVRRANPIDWSGARQAMIDNPGMWVKLVENVSASTLQQIRRGRNQQFRATEDGGDLHKFEFAARRPAQEGLDEKYRKNFTDVWGRYVA